MSWLHGASRNRAVVIPRPPLLMFLAPRTARASRPQTDLALLTAHYRTRHPCRGPRRTTTEGRPYVRMAATAARLIRVRMSVVEEGHTCVPTRLPALEIST